MGPRILVTGGTGHLGQDLVPLLLSRFSSVRVLARSRPNFDNVEWARGDLGTGAGLHEALTGVETVVHAATFSPIAKQGGIRLADLFRTPSVVDLDGTRRLLAAAEAASVGHFIFVSIVGLEKGALPYSRVKLAAEKLVRDSNLAWTVMRATPFFYLMRDMLKGMLRFPVAALPSTLVDPIDTSDVAEYLADCVANGPKGTCREIGGPETLPFAEFGRQFAEHRRLKRAILPFYLPSKLAGAAGFVRSSGLRGKLSWRQWLDRDDRGATSEEM